MDTMIHKHSAQCIYVVPEGLKELMSDITREVLRTQPENLYVFIADYLEALLLTRENARVAAKLVQSITEIAETTMEFLSKTGMGKESIDKAISIMNQHFKEKIREESIATQHYQNDFVDEANIITTILAEAAIDDEYVQASTSIINMAYKKFKLRKEAEKQLLSGMIDWRIAARSAIKLYRQTGVTNEEVNRAATLIKAAYKGYYTRRIMKKLTEEQKLLSEMQADKNVESSEPKLGAVDSKSVTIDYDSVIPHVDFDDADVKLASPIVEYIMDVILEKVVLSEKKSAKKKSKPGRKPQKPKSAPGGVSDTKRPSVASKASSQASKRTSVSTAASHADKRSAASARSSAASQLTSRSKKSEKSEKSEKSARSHASQRSSVTASARSSRMSERSSRSSERSGPVSERSSRVTDRSSFVSRSTVASGRSSVTSRRSSATSRRSSQKTKSIGSPAESVVSSRRSVKSAQSAGESQRSVKSAGDKSPDQHSNKSGRRSVKLPQEV
ncbi:unnamed protein product [Phyllotreta striolata]|uniref:RIIa domain-containing protein n=1 Tax=Phyllotreta striolata TaxID=444603 RepID=A0A9N9TTY3_PHYSR|nr:unnamed protein product [Phyllotreta striolata]